MASLLMLLTSVAMTAQESKWSVTPKAGMTVATLAGEDAEYCSNAIGWTAGVDLGRRLSERVELTLGVGFTKNVVKDDIGTSIVSTRVFDEGRMTFEYIDVPIGINVKLWQGLSASLGVQPSLMTAGKERFFYDEYACDSFEDRVKFMSNPYSDPRTSEYTHFLKRESEHEQQAERECQHRPAVRVQACDAGCPLPLRPDQRDGHRQAADVQPLSRPE